MRSLFMIATFLFISNFLSAQIQDLENIAEGEIVYSSILSNSNGDLYGYIYFFDQGKIDAENTQFEYVLLDKNLNKAANGTYQEKLIDKAVTWFQDCTLMGDEILITKVVGIKYIKMLSFNQVISLKDNTVSKPFYFENGSFQDLNMFSGAAIHEKYKIDEHYSHAVPVNFQNIQGFFVVENYKNKKNFNEKSLNLYDYNKKQIWSYDYNLNGTKKNWKEFDILSLKDGIIVGGLSKRTNNKYVDEFSIVGIDALTGKQIFEYAFENENSTYSHNVIIKTYGDGIYIVGNYSPYSKNDFNWEKNLGVYRIKLDKRGNEISKKYHPWSAIASNLEANKYGVVSKGYSLTPMRFFIMKDGSVSYLSEKFKDNSSTIGAPKSSDFVLFNFDNEFNFRNNHTIEKDKTKWAKNDYLFHQYIKDDEGVVFFFRDHKKDDETKDRNWILGINTIINGEFKEETIPMSSEDFFIHPIPAKEGYILLQEFNEKSNLNQIRLEKLNY